MHKKSESRLEADRVNESERVHHHRLIKENQIFDEKQRRDAE